MAIGHRSGSALGNPYPCFLDCVGLLRWLPYRPIACQLVASSARLLWCSYVRLLSLHPVEIVAVWTELMPFSSTFSRTDSRFFLNSPTPSVCRFPHSLNCLECGAVTDRLSLLACRSSRCRFSRQLDRTRRKCFRFDLFCLNEDDALPHL